MSSEVLPGEFDSARLEALYLEHMSAAGPGVVADFEALCGAHPDHALRLRALHTAYGLDAA